MDIIKAASEWLRAITKEEAGHAFRGNQYTEGQSGPRQSDPRRYQADPNRYSYAQSEARTGASAFPPRAGNPDAIYGGNLAEKAEALHRDNLSGGENGNYEPDVAHATLARAHREASVRPGISPEASNIHAMAASMHEAAARDWRAAADAFASGDDDAADQMNERFIDSSEGARDMSARAEELATTGEFTNADSPSVTAPQSIRDMPETSFSAERDLTTRGTMNLVSGDTEAAASDFDEAARVSTDRAATTTDPTIRSLSEEAAGMATEIAENIRSGKADTGSVSDSTVDLGSLYRTIAAGEELRSGGTATVDYARMLNDSTDAPHMADYHEALAERHRDREDFLREAGDETGARVEREAYDAHDRAADLHHEAQYAIEEGASARVAGAKGLDAMEATNLATRASIKAQSANASEPSGGYASADSQSVFGRVPDIRNGRESVSDIVDGELDTGSAMGLEAMHELTAEQHRDAAAAATDQVTRDAHESAAQAHGEAANLWQAISDDGNADEGLIGLAIDSSTRAGRASDFARGVDPTIRVAKGDAMGHEFRGNQYTSGSGGSKMGQADSSAVVAVYNSNAPYRNGPLKLVRDSDDPEFFRPRGKEVYHGNVVIHVDGNVNPRTGKSSGGTKQSDTFSNNKSYAVVQGRRPGGTIFTRLVPCDRSWKIGDTMTFVDGDTHKVKGPGAVVGITDPARGEAHGYVPDRPLSHNSVY